MSLNLAFLMSRLALKDIEILEIEDLLIAFSPKEFIEIMDNMRELPMIFDDINMKRIDEPKILSVRVYCPKCKGGKNIIWKGSLAEWSKLMSNWFIVNSEPPEWYNYALRHESAHPGHTIMVEYPSRTVPLRL